MCKSLHYSSFKLSTTLLFIPFGGMNSLAECHRGVPDGAFGSFLQLSLCSGGILTDFK